MELFGSKEVIWGLALGEFLWFFMVLGWIFMVPGRVSWFFMVPGWVFMVFHGFSYFFMVPGWFFMVFLQNVPAQTVSWPNDPF